jgi:DNA-binding CsgD family transcriptional regulator
MKPHHERFLKLICSEMTYKEIANEMGISEEDCRNMAKNLSVKFRVKGRFGLMLYSIKTKLVKPNEIKFQMEGRPPLYERFPLVIGGVMLLEKQPPILREEQERTREAFDKNVQEGLGQN